LPLLILLILINYRFKRQRYAKNSIYLNFLHKKILKSTFSFRFSEKKRIFAIRKFNYSSFYNIKENGKKCIAESKSRLPAETAKGATGCGESKVRCSDTECRKSGGDQETLP
jgi:hypothetical protein